MKKIFLLLLIGITNHVYASQKKQSPQDLNADIQWNHLTDDLEALVKTLDQATGGDASSAEHWLTLAGAIDQRMRTHTDKVNKADTSAPNNTSAADVEKKDK